MSTSLLDEVVGQLDDTRDQLTALGEGEIRLRAPALPETSVLGYRLHRS